MTKKEKKISEIHASILLEESFEMLHINNSSVHIDATLGMGGHAEYYLSHNKNLQLFGFDQDPFARKIAQERLQKYSNRFEIIPQNFETLQQVTDEKKIEPTSILFDIGVSSLQFDDGKRGFSFRFEAPLDMRMNPENELTAEIIINEWSQEKLCEIFTDYGEEKYAYLLSKKIVEEREINPFLTTVQLAEFIEKVKPWKKKSWKKGGGKSKESAGNAAALVFQALRIAVNRELDVLEKALHQAIKILKKGGRLAVISFHSLEDRIVKKCFEEYISKEKINKYAIPSESENNKYSLRRITKKPFTPSSVEIEKNPRSRSAKMRVVEKLL